MFDVSNVYSGEEQYLNVLEAILNDGTPKGDRTGTGTLSSFGQVMRFDLSDNAIPLLTTKQMYHKSFTHETLWFISGSTDVKYLKDHGISIWDSWVIPETAVYRDKTNEELLAQIGKKFESTEVNVYCVLASHFADIPKQHGVNALGNCLVKLTLKEDGSKTVDVYGSVADHADIGSVMRYVAAELEIPTQVLAGGSIGNGAYGVMWRNIEDTRLVDNGQALNSPKYKSFQLVGVVPDGRAVVTRKIDQLQNAIDLLRTNPDSRRIIVHAFDNRMVDFCALPPCHAFFQFWTRELELNERLRWMERNDPSLTEMFNYRLRQTKLIFSSEQHMAWLTDNKVPARALSCMLYQRSADYPVGIPFNMAQYALLTHMVAQVTNMVAEELIHVTGDSHIYQNQVDLVEEQLTRAIIDQETRVILNTDVKEIDDFTFEDIAITGYDHYHPAIKYPVAV